MRGRSLFSRLLSTHLLVAIGALGILGISLDRVLEQRAIRNLRERLAVEGRLVETAIAAADAGTLQSQIRSFGSVSATRITVIAQDGVVLADSEHDPATMENHAARPEVKAALERFVGSDQRSSATLGKPFLYVALPIKDGRVIRTAVPATEVYEQRRQVREVVGIGAAIMMFVVLGISVIVARSIALPLGRMSEQVERVAEGELGSRLDPEGTREQRVLAEAVNRMASELASRLDDLARETSLREQILAEMPAGVMLVESSGQTAYANPAARDFLGGVGVPSDVREQSVAEFTTHFPKRRELRAESANLADGRRLVIIQDVSEALRVEAIRRDFVAHASHELKTPVGGILSVAETIKTALADDSESVPKFADTLIREARRLSDLVQDLLDLARLEQTALEPVPVNLSLVASHEGERAATAARSKGLRLVTDIEEAVMTAGNPDELGLAIRNLLENAVRYTATGEISLKVDRDEEAILVVVKDTGIGIPTRDLSRIFERFYRVDSARSRETGGTGLGLSIVRHVVERHGGEVSASSELGVGSEFRLRLPRPMGSQVERGRQGIDS